MATETPLLSGANRAYTPGMADVRPLRALRYDPAHVDPAAAIAPPYDVISAFQQDELYNRSPYNVVRVEYGRELVGDDPSSNRYTRANAELRAWQGSGVLIRDAVPAVYHYRLTFDWASRTYERSHYLAVVRLEEWAKGVIRPHERTLSGPKADRLSLLRSTRTQISPVYCLYRDRHQGSEGSGALPLYDLSADGQRHVLSAITDASAIDSLRTRFASADFYIADGHHRYETALAFRDECRAGRSAWTGDEPENFVLMAMTDAADPGLLVLPTHRLLHRAVPGDALSRLRNWFEVLEVRADDGAASHERALREASIGGDTSFVALGLERDRAHLLRLRDRASVERLMPAMESTAWKRLDVNVLQFTVLDQIFGIDDAGLAAGRAVSYTQSADDAVRAIEAGDASCGFLLAATPVEQIIAVSDAGGRMPQKSTFFHPKLPTGLVLNPLD